MMRKWGLLQLTEEFAKSRKRIVLRVCLIVSLLLTILSTTKVNAQSQERCFVPAERGTGLERNPTDFLNIGVDIGIAYEGFLAIGEAVVPSPTGDLSVTAGPYDPLTGRLYIWGYWRNGWVNVNSFERSEIRPNLYWPADDIEDVTEILRSEALGVQFYSGWTAPHWLTGHQSFQVIMISGREMTRIGALEELQLHYIGDDPEMNLAVFVKESRYGTEYDDPVWFDGTGIVPPPDGLEQPVQRCPRSG